jgi:RNA polymerase sigma-70 factor (ECF subfamily)
LIHRSRYPPASFEKATSYWPARTKPVAENLAIRGVVNTRSTNGDRNDEELMSELAAGRREALGPLHSRYASLVFGLAARSLDRATAEEIAQEVFLTVWQKAATFDPARGTFRAWVSHITHTRVINELRRRGRRPSATSDADGTRSENLADSAPDPAEAVWRDHRRAVVRAAVETLPPPQREALSLAFLEDLTHEQVAAFLNLPVGTAKSRIRAGLKSLRFQLAPLVTVGLILASLLTFAGLRERAQQTALRRQGRALSLVTNSEVVPKRLSAAPGTNPAAHGNYRGRRGVDLAVLTLSSLAPAPEGYEYRAWASHGGRWTLLGRPQLDNDGRCLIIAEGPELATPPDQLQVTLEPVGNRADAKAAPTGPPVVRWPAL